MSAPEKRLRFKTKIAYGFGNFGLQAVDMALRLYLLKFYVDDLGLDPFWAGSASAIALVWDAFTDPWMGRISDALGKRRVFFLPGGLTVSILIAVLFFGPNSQSQTYLFLFLFGNYLLLNTAMTIIDIPYHAMGGEISDDTNERASAYAWRLVFANLGSFAALAIPLFYSEQTTSQRYQWVGIWIGLMVFVSAFILRIGTSDRRDLRSQGDLKKIPLNPFSSFKVVFRNRSFFYLVICYSVAMIGLAINTAVALFYYEYRLRLKMEQTQQIIIVFMLVLILGLAFWVWVAKRYGKRIPLALGIGLMGIGGSILYPLFQPGNMTGPLIFAGVAGVLAGSVVLLDAWLADIIQVDEGGEDSQAGVIFGFWRLASKVVRAGALFAVGFCLDWIGFTPGQTQTLETEWALALFYGPGVNFLFIVAALLVLCLPIRSLQRESKH